ncbi:hypothetical protein O7635_33780 [Asanoa sp. WMMD1127]|uniref:hypothetical protein n=1 Tax=Asanoa sp. WMMD1127 TaxID=3016107 RepID=UPI0024164D3B|nr:hypothetical protein [Asanoa sp. WMMD1127]MDG4826845.1 hypothetical protein [Asanoa sp. WMMD1127]
MDAVLSEHGSPTTRRTVHVGCSAIRWVDDEPQPGWVEVSILDADGRDLRFFDKPPIFDADGVLTRETDYPVPLTVECTVLAEDVVDGRTLLTVRLTGWGGDDVCRVRADQVVDPAR